MAKLTLNDITESATGFDIAINQNNTLVEAAIENTLSRDGTGPNQMESDLDMNSYRIVNLADAVLPQDAVTLNQLTIAQNVGPVTIGQMTDVDLTGINTGDILQWDGMQFVPVAIPLAKVQDGTADNRVLIWNVANDQWEETTSAVQVRDDEVGVGGQIVLRGTLQSTIGGAGGNFVVDVGNSGSPILEAWDDYPTRTTGCGIVANFGLSNPNHTMEFHMVGPSSALQPGLELEQDGIVHFLQRTHSFDGSGLNMGASSVINLPHRATPGAPDDGDIWTESGGVYGQVNGSTKRLDNPVGSGFSGVSLYRSTEFTLGHTPGSPPTGELAVPFDMEIIDTGAADFGTEFHSTSVNITRITIPNGVNHVRLHGSYVLKQNITPPPLGTNPGHNGSGLLHIRIRKNGNSFLSLISGVDYIPWTTHGMQGSPQEHGMEVSSVIVPVSAGDYFELMGQTQGSDFAGLDTKAGAVFMMEVID